MSRMNRRRFTWVATSGIASAALVACGGDAVDEDLTPTQIPDAAGAPPTLAPQATPFSSDEAAGGEAAGGGEQAGGGGAITVEALDALAFDPSEIEAAPGQEIHVVNAGSLQHDFVVDELDIATELLNGGEEETVTVPEDATVGDSFTFYCSVPGHREAGMEGTLTIVEAGAAPAEEEAGAEEEVVAEEDAAATGGGPFEVQALDALAFDPSEFTIPADTEVEIHVINAGQLQHDFIIEETDFGTELLNGGEEETLTVNLPEGEYVYFCSVPGHREGGMEGTLIVSTDAAAAGAEEEVATPEEEAAAAGGPTGPVTITCIDIDYEEKEVTIAADTDVEFHVVNEGALQHDFNIEETDFATEILNSGEEQTITVNLPEGEYIYFCSVPGHREAGMWGTLTVSADAGGDAAAAEEGDAASAEEGGDEAVAAGEPVTVTAVDIAFEPTSFEVAPGQDIHVVNEGALQHDFVVDGMDLATELLNSGEEATITVPDDAEPGDYTYFCSVPGHREAGMEGTLTVE